VDDITFCLVVGRTAVHLFGISGLISSSQQLSLVMLDQQCRIARGIIGFDEATCQV